MRDLFMSEHLLVNLHEKHAISTELSNVNRESINANLIVNVDVIVNQAEYQYEV